MINSPNFIAPMEKGALNSDFPEFVTAEQVGRQLPADANIIKLVSNPIIIRCAI